VSKYLILSERTSSPSCSIVTLNKSPSSFCSRKKNAPCDDLSPTRFQTLTVDRLKPTLILCITAATMMFPRLLSPR
jgi:hypothetical protein